MDYKAANLPGEIISIEAFSRVIECIYDCALDPVRWTHAIDAISLAAPRQRDHIGQLAVSGHETEGAVADRDLAVVRLLAPHVRRAIAIRDALDMHTMTISTFQATLDLIGPGVVLVDRDAKVIYASRAARSMLAADSLGAGSGTHLPAADLGGAASRHCQCRLPDEERVVDLPTFEKWSGQHAGADGNGQRR
jgi:PAS domain-containing protein